jgi:hypothetical protein
LKQYRNYLTVHYHQHAHAVINFPYRALPISLHYTTIVPVALDWYYCVNETANVSMQLSTLYAPVPSCSATIILTTFQEQIQGKHFSSPSTFPSKDVLFNPDHPFHSCIW